MSASHGAASYVLPSPWTVRFQVKQRQQSESKRSIYTKNEFLQSFVQVGQPQRSLGELMDTVAKVPSYKVLKRGILTAFRDGINPLYEDRENQKGCIFKFSVAKQRDVLEENIQRWQETLQKQGRDSPEAKKQQRALCPLIDLELIPYLTHFVLVLAFTGGIRPVEGQLNGVYIKTERGIITFELWFSRFSAQIKEDMNRQLQALLAHLGLNAFAAHPQLLERFRDEQCNGCDFGSLQSQVQTIEIESGHIRGQSEFARGGGRGRREFSERGGDRPDRPDRHGRHERSERPDRGRRDWSDGHERGGRDGGANWRKK